VFGQLRFGAAGEPVESASQLFADVRQPMSKRAKLHGCNAQQANRCHEQKHDNH
jgi:hypothetical protein